MSDPAHRLGEDRLRRALACADLGSFEVDASTRLVVVDRRGCELLCITADGEVPLDDYYAAVDPADRARVREHLEAVLVAEGDPYHDEFRTVGRRWVAVDGRTLSEGHVKVARV